MDNKWHNLARDTLASTSCRRRTSCKAPERHQIDMLTSIHKYYTKRKQEKEIIVAEKIVSLKYLHCNGDISLISNLLGMTCFLIWKARCMKLPELLLLFY